MSKRSVIQILCDPDCLIFQTNFEPYSFVRISVGLTPPLMANDGTVVSRDNKLVLRV